MITTPKVGKNTVQSLTLALALCASTSATTYLCSDGPETDCTYVAGSDECMTVSGRCNNGWCGVAISEYDCGGEVDTLCCAVENPYYPNYCTCCGCA